MSNHNSTNEKTHTLNGTGGIESWLGITGGAIFLLSVGIFLGYLILYADHSRQVDASGNLIIGAVSLIAGIVSFVVMRALADVVRLLKKLNQLPFGGSISRATAHENARSVLCPKCGAMNWASRTECRECHELLREASVPAE